MLTVQHVSDARELQSLGREWNDLALRCRIRHFLLGHEWNVTWWKHFGTGHDLWILLVREGAHIVAIVPLMRTTQTILGLPIRSLGFMLSGEAGNKQSDFLLLDREEEAVRSIVAYWHESRSMWDVIILDGIVEDSPTLPLLRRTLDESRLRSTAPMRSRSIYYHKLDGTWKSFLASKTHNFRKSYDLLTRKLQAAGRVEFRRWTGPETLDTAMAKVFEIEVRSWKAAAGTAAALLPELRSFYTDAARLFSARGEFEVRTLEVGGHPIASTTCIVRDGIVWGLKNSFDAKYGHLSPGRAIFLEMIKDSYARRFEAIDFNGNYPYLARYASQMRHYNSISIFNSRPYSRALGAMRSLQLLARERSRKSRLPLREQR